MSQFPTLRHAAAEQPSCTAVNFNTHISRMTSSLKTLKRQDFALSFRLSHEAVSALCFKTRGSENILNAETLNFSRRGHRHRFDSFAQCATRVRLSYHAYSGCCNAQLSSDINNDFCNNPITFRRTQHVCYGKRVDNEKTKGVVYS